LLFIDSDMTLTPGVVGDCVEAIQISGAPAVVVPEVSVGEGFLAHCRALERSCYPGDDSIEAARFFHRREFEASRGFDENLTAFEDWDLSMRIASGRHLPRTQSRITHDEGKLRLSAVLAKKRYYAGSASAFWRKHPAFALSQINVVFRPAYIRHWRRLLHHPLLTAGFLGVKGLEAIAIVIGTLQARRDPVRG
jgi:arabinofuranan 3-O-arabinosyltransferase